MIFFVGVGRGKMGDYLEKGWVGISHLHRVGWLNNFVIAKNVVAAFERLLPDFCDCVAAANVNCRLKEKQ